MSQEFERFAAYLKVLDRLIEDASKDEIAEVARVLALHLAHYQKKYVLTAFHARARHCPCASV